MTISALVLTLDPESGDGAVAALSSRPEAAVGARIGNRLPVVLETDGLREGAALAEELLAVPGVSNVEVLFVDFEGAVS